jgi:hypothetical protein
MFAESNFTHMHTHTLSLLTLCIPSMHEQMSSITHVDDVAEDLPVIDQAVYDALENPNVVGLLDGIDDDDEALLPAEYDRIKQSTRDRRNTVLSHIRQLDPNLRELTESMLSAMLQAGAGMFHRHTVERQVPSHQRPELLPASCASPQDLSPGCMASFVHLGWQVEQHDPKTPDKRIASATALTEERKSKVRPAAVTNHAAERIHGILKMVRHVAPTLLHHHLSGRVRSAHLPSE